MSILDSPIICDGCGLPASPDHISERVVRLELATRYRPIHISTLFVALAPLNGIENDFYTPSASSDLFDFLPNAAEIVVAPGKSSSEADGNESETAKLVEFQRQGCYFCCLSECPIPKDPDAAAAAIARLGANLVRRIRFNYKPKHVTLIGRSLAPLVEVLNRAGLGPLLLANRALQSMAGEPDDWVVRADYANS